MKTPLGEIAVSYERTEAGVQFNISVPTGFHADFRIPSYTCTLVEGENEFTVSESQEGCADRAYASRQTEKAVHF